MGMLISCIDTSIVSTSLVKISEDFKDYADASWVVLAYLLTYMGMICV
jgi:MFS family permease